MVFCLLLPRKENFWKVLLWAASGFFLMFASGLSLELLDGFNPISTQGGLAQTLLKMGIIGLTVWQLI